MGPFLLYFWLPLSRLIIFLNSKQLLEAHKLTVVCQLREHELLEFIDWEFAWAIFIYYFEKLFNPVHWNVDIVLMEHFIDFLAIQGIWPIFVKFNENILNLKLLFEFV